MAITDTRENEDAPLANPIPFRNVLATLSEGVAVLHMGRVIYANAALCEMSGKNRGEIIGCSFLDLAVDADRGLVADYLKPFEAASASGIEFRLQRATTATRQVHLKASSLQLQGIYDNAVGICCCLSDITGYQDEIIGLQRENRRMRSHLDDTESVLMDVAPHDCYDILLVNKYAEALLGCSTKDILSGKRHLFDFVHPDNLQAVTGFYKGFPDSHESAEMEYRIISNDGNTKWVRDMGNTLFVERGGGMARRVDHTLVDITEQKNKEFELEEERRKLSSIIKNSNEMIYSVDKAGNFLDLNQAGMKLLGISGDFRRCNILDFYTDHRKRDRLLQQLNERGQAQQLARWKVGDEAEIDVVINAVGERNPETDNWTYQGIVHNVTRTLELKKVETIKKMAGGLSDQINTPLMILQMSMEMIREVATSEPVDTETILEQLNEMEYAYRKIVGPMELVREKYWRIEEVSDGAGGTIYEIQEKP